MSNQLTNELKAQLFANNSSDPLLPIFTLDHPSFAGTIRLVNNTEDIVSRGNTFTAFPVKISLPTEDGETVPTVKMEFDNVSLLLISELRTVTTPIDVKMELILASTPDVVQYELLELKLKNIIYDQNSIRGTLTLDDFLSTSLTSEKYNASNFPGLF